MCSILQVSPRGNCPPGDTCSIPPRSHQHTCPLKCNVGHCCGHLHCPHRPSSPTLPLPLLLPLPPPLPPPPSPPLSLLLSPVAAPLTSIVTSRHCNCRHCCSSLLPPIVAATLPPLCLRRHQSTLTIVATVSVVDIGHCCNHLHCQCWPLSCPSPSLISTIIAAVSIVDVSHHRGRLGCGCWPSSWLSPLLTSAIVVAVSVVDVGHCIGCLHH